MATIGFLHTSAVHTSTFETLVHEMSPNTEALTVVDEVLLDRARSHGVDDMMVVGGVADRLAQFVGVDVVVCTCSTIGALAEEVGKAAGVTVVRVDRPMAESAVASGDRIAVAAAVDSTLGPTRELLESVAAAAGASPHIAVHLIDGAWAHFEVGDTEAYLDTIAAALPALAADADVVVLAQASMAPAADRVTLDVPVLASPRTALHSLLASRE